MDSKSTASDTRSGTQRGPQSSTWTYAINNIGDLFDDDTRPFQIPTVAVSPSVPDSGEASRPIGGTPAEYLSAGGKRPKPQAKKETPNAGQEIAEAATPRAAPTPEEPALVPAAPAAPVPIAHPASQPVATQGTAPAVGAAPAPSLSSVVADSAAVFAQPSEQLAQPRPGMQTQPSVRGKAPAPQGDAVAAQLHRPEYSKEGTKEDAEPKPEAKGKVTSALAALLLVAAVAVAVVPLPQVVTEGKAAPAAINLICALPVSGLLAWLAVLVGTRSVAQPKGTPGRGRGLVAVMSAPLAPVVAAVLLVVAVLGVARTIVADGNLSKVQKDGGLSIVYPKGSFDIDKGVADLATKMGLLPENTLNADNSIPLSTSNDSIYMGTTAIDLASIQGGDAPKVTEDQLLALVAAVQQLEQNGYSVALGPDEKSATITDASGEQLTVTLDSTSRRPVASAQRQGAGDSTAAAGVSIEGAGVPQPVGTEGQPAAGTAYEDAGVSEEEAAEGYGENVAEDTKDLA